ncbi:MAG: M48 family metalloprotease [Candidatus Micrarchaeia archaeon]
MISILILMFEWFIQPYIIKDITKFHFLGDKEYPELQKTVDALCIKAGVKRPKLAIAPSRLPNVFIFGRSKSNSILVVNEGTLSLLSKDELNVVLMREFYYLEHNDISAITTLSFWPTLTFFAAGSLILYDLNYGENPRSNRDKVYIFALVGLLTFILYVLTLPFISIVSRKKVVLADEYSATVLRSPENLSTALIKITMFNASFSNARVSSTSTKFLSLIDYFTAIKDSKELLRNKEEIKKMLSSSTANYMFKSTRISEANMWYTINSLFSTHPKTFVRIQKLYKLKLDFDKDLKY